MFLERVPFASSKKQIWGKEEIVGTIVFSGWWFRIFFMFTPKFGEDEPILTHIFQKGWFNHQLVFYLSEWFQISNNICLFYFLPGFAGENESIFGVCRCLIKGWWKNAFPWIFSESMKCSPTFGWLYHHKSEEYSINGKYGIQLNSNMATPQSSKTCFFLTIYRNIFRNEKKQIWWHIITFLYKLQTLFSFMISYTNYY